MSRAAAKAAPTAAASSDLAVMRACACEGHAKDEERCEECEEAARRGAQAKLWLSTPGDAAEREADRLADAALSASAPAARPVAVGAPVRAGPARQAGRHAGGAFARGARSAVEVAVGSGGRPLPAPERAFFEARLGHDLGGVRVHTGAAAARAAGAIGARAFALGRHIAFGAGQYAPGGAAGRRLLAHEIVHTLQQGGGAVRRTCLNGPEPRTPDKMKEFEGKAAAILAHPKFPALKGEGKTVARHIVDGARGSECPLYYMGKLETLFATDKQPAADQATKARANVAAGVTTHTAEMARRSPAEIDAEEAATRDKGRKWTPRQGHNAAPFQVDRSDPRNLVVRLRVRLTPKGDGTAKDVEQTKTLEDSIEKAASGPGYTFDIVFVAAPGADVIEAGVNPAKWTTAGNWVGNAKTIAHEAHHLLGLDDRYNYIESHAGNKGMEIEDRLHWFREQMVRPIDPLASTSMMEKQSAAGRAMSDEDVCAVAGGDFRGCLSARLKALPMARIEARAKVLTTPYRPQGAAYLLLLREAWDLQDTKEKQKGCDAKDPLCGLVPPTTLFGDPGVVGADAIKMPLTNPHAQPSGATLRRTAKP